MTKYANGKNQQKVIHRKCPPKPRPDLVPRDLALQDLGVKTPHRRSLHTKPSLHGIWPKGKGSSWAFINTDSFAPDAVAIYIRPITL